MKPIHEDLVGLRRFLAELDPADDEGGAAVVLHGLECFGRDDVIDLPQVVAVELRRRGLPVHLVGSEGRIGDDGIHGTGEDEPGVHGPECIAVADVREAEGVKTLEPLRVQLVHPGPPRLRADQEHPVPCGGLVDRPGAQARQLARQVRQRRRRGIGLVLQAGRCPDVQPRLREVQIPQGDEGSQERGPCLPAGLDRGAGSQSDDDFDRLLPFLHPENVGRLAVDLSEHGLQLVVVLRQATGGHDGFHQRSRFPIRRGVHGDCVDHGLQLDRDLIGGVHAPHVHPVVLHHVASSVVPRPKVGAKLPHRGTEVVGEAGRHLREATDPGFQVEPGHDNPVLQEIRVHAGHGVQRRTLRPHLLADPLLGRFRRFPRNDLVVVAEPLLLHGSGHFPVHALRRDLRGLNVGSHGNGFGGGSGGRFCQPRVFCLTRPLWCRGKPLLRCRLRFLLHGLLLNGRHLHVDGILREPRLHPVGYELFRVHAHGPSVHRLDVGGKLLRPFCPPGLHLLGKIGPFWLLLLDLLLDGLLHRPCVLLRGAGLLPHGLASILVRGLHLRQGHARWRRGHDISRLDDFRHLLRDRLRLFGLDLRFLHLRRLGGHGRNRPELHLLPMRLENIRIAQGILLAPCFRFLRCFGFRLQEVLELHVDVGFLGAAMGGVKFRHGRRWFGHLCGFRFRCGDERGFWTSDQSFRSRLRDLHRRGGSLDFLEFRSGYRRIPSTYVRHLRFWCIRGHGLAGGSRRRSHRLLLLDRVAPFRERFRRTGDRRRPKGGPHHGLDRCGSHALEQILAGHGVLGAVPLELPDNFFSDFRRRFHGDFSGTRGHGPDRTCRSRRLRGRLQSSLAQRSHRGRVQRKGRRRGSHERLACLSAGDVLLDLLPGFSTGKTGRELRHGIPCFIRRLHQVVVDAAADVGALHDPTNTDRGGSAENTSGHGRPCHRQRTRREICRQGWIGHEVLGLRPTFGQRTHHAAARILVRLLGAFLAQLLTGSKLFRLHPFVDASKRFCISKILSNAF